MRKPSSSTKLPSASRILVAEHLRAAGGGTIGGLGFDYQVKAPRDIATGQSSG